jgi:hypothetical protein
MELFEHFLAAAVALVGAVYRAKARRSNQERHLNEKQVLFDCLR